MMKRTGGGRVFFTGPDGVGDYRPRSGYFQRYIGEGSASPESTGDLAYLTRAAPGAPPPTPRGRCAGEVGWCWELNRQLNGQTLRSNMQIKKTDVRVAVEDSVTHRFQSLPSVKSLAKADARKPEGGAVAESEDSEEFDS